MPIILHPPEERIEAVLLVGQMLNVIVDYSYVHNHGGAGAGDAHNNHIQITASNPIQLLVRAGVFDPTYDVAVTGLWIHNPTEIDNTIVRLRMFAIQDEHHPDPLPCSNGWLDMLQRQIKKHETLIIVPGAQVQVLTVSN